MRELERQVLLQVMDRKWREHLYEMDYLKEGIGLRAMAQRDPLIEYQREGFDMFAAMLEGIKEETVGHLFNVRVQAGAEPRQRRPRRHRRLPRRRQHRRPAQPAAPTAAAGSATPPAAAATASGRHASPEPATRTDPRHAACCRRRSAERDRRS